MRISGSTSISCGEVHFNGEEIYIYHPDPAHADADSIIHFRHANVMHVGDIPASLRYPNIGVDDGGSMDGMIAAAQQVMKIANPEISIIPGHLGPVVGFKEIQQQLEMFAAVRDRVLFRESQVCFNPARAGGRADYSLLTSTGFCRC